jgi:DNA repair exonuclease SbcCD ATPase subunit
MLMNNLMEKEKFIEELKEALAQTELDLENKTREISMLTNNLMEKEKLIEELKEALVLAQNNSDQISTLEKLLEDSKQETMIAQRKLEEMKSLAESTEGYRGVEAALEKDMTQGSTPRCGDTAELERRIASLETEIFKTEAFKRRLAKELSGLNPSLKVFDLVKLPLSELFERMLATIVEKEGSLISDLNREYEGKLSSAEERINQLEDEERKRKVWIEEIEAENDKMGQELERLRKESNAFKTQTPNTDNKESYQKKVRTFHLVILCHLTTTLDIMLIKI